MCPKRETLERQGAAETGRTGPIWADRKGSASCPGRMQQRCGSWPVPFGHRSRPILLMDESLSLRLESADPYTGLQERAA